MQGYFHSKGSCLNKEYVKILHKFFFIEICVEHVFKSEIV